MQKLTFRTKEWQWFIHSSNKVTHRIPQLWGPSLWVKTKKKKFIVQAYPPVANNIKNNTTASGVMLGKQVTQSYALFTPLLSVDTSCGSYGDPRSCLGHFTRCNLGCQATHLSGLPLGLYVHFAINHCLWPSLVSGWTGMSKQQQ